MSGIFILIFLVVLMGNLLLDRYQFKRGMKINHGVESFFRGMLLVASALYFSYDMLSFFALILFQFSWFWIWFDVLMNVFVLKMPALYVGKTAEIDKFFRNRFSASFEETVLIVKGACLIISSVFGLIVLA